MADGFMENKMESYLAGKHRSSYTHQTLTDLLRKNRSCRGYDASFKVTEEHLEKIIAVNTLLPSARNQQVLRFRPVLSDEAPEVLKHIHLGGALKELHLPFPGTEPNAFIVICTAGPEDRYVNMDIGISAQSMLLKAVEIGLNGICIGAFEKEPVKAALGLEYEPLLILAIGKGIEKIELTEIGAEEPHAYYRQDGIHFVPKVRLKDLIIGGDPEEI